MMRIWWILGLTVALGPLMGLGQAQAASADTARIVRRPNAALLMRLARARQLSNRPRTFQTQVGVAVAARRHGDQIEQQKQTLEILNNQYLRGTAATTPTDTGSPTTSKSTLADWAIVRQAFVAAGLGEPTWPVGRVPEPTGLILLFVGGMIMFSLTRRSPR